METKTRIVIAINIAYFLCVSMLPFYTCSSGDIAGLSVPGDTVEPIEPSGPVILIEKAHWGLIENDCSEEVANANTVALQLAIDSLTRAGNYRLKLEQGVYCMRGEGKTAVQVPSNFRLDLGGSTLQLAANNTAYSALLRVEYVENVKIFNGTLIGDKVTHYYETAVSKYEGGVGIWIYGSMNVELYDLTIRDVTGDCVMVGEISPKCINVTIRNVTCSGARRGGFVATNVDGLIIRDSHVFEIYDDFPVYREDGSVRSVGAQACIAFETSDPRQYISNVQIFNNLLDGSSGEIHNRLFLNTHGGSKDIVIRDNELIGSYVARFGKNILFKNNKISNGTFFWEGAVDNRGSVANGMNFIVEDNEFYNYSIGSSGGGTSENLPNHKQNIAYIGNKFYSSNIIISSPTSTAFVDNQFIDLDQTTDRCVWVYLRELPKDGEEHRVYFAGNTMASEFKEPKRYSIVFGVRGNFSMSAINELPNVTLPTPSRLPEWYYESNNRAEAMAFINSWKWY